MNFYKLEWKKSAVKELKPLPKNYISEIIKTVERLSLTPFPPGIKKLSSSKRTYRIRVGMYRIIYEVFEEKLMINIVRIRHRKDVYKK